MGKKAKGTSGIYEVRLSDNAVSNIEEITNYIAFVNNQPINAIKVGDEIFKKIDQIGLRPYTFKECDLLVTKSKIYRQAICLTWYIIYKIMDTQITILGIIHASRKPSRRKALRTIN